jgi:hypothetical protein
VFLREVVWFSTPVAAADNEWINGDQQGELFEALTEFSLSRRSSFRHRGFHFRDTMGFVLCPTKLNRLWGAFFCLLILCEQKE